MVKHPCIARIRRVQAMIARFSPAKERLTWFSAAVFFLSGYPLSAKHIGQVDAGSPGAGRAKLRLPGLPG
jgi:hypothetical protein